MGFASRGPFETVFTMPERPQHRRWLPIRVHPRRTLQMLLSDRSQPRRRSLGSSTFHLFVEPCRTGVARRGDTGPLLSRVSETLAGNGFGASVWFLRRGGQKVRSWSGS